MEVDPASFLDLKSIAAECVCICIRPEFMTKSLLSLGFLEVLSAVDFEIQHWRTHCWTNKASSLIILACQGDDTSSLLEICQLLLENESSPTLLAVLMPREGALQDTDDVQDLMLNDTLLEHGCDDVLSLSVGERVTSLRVRTAIIRTEKMGAKAQAAMGEMEAKARHAIQVANRRFLWNLPGNILENIPSFDKTLDERNASGDLGSLGGVGAYDFECVLGEGSFGRVYKSEHPQKGHLAIKVISKEAVKGAHGLFSLDREFCIMCNLPTHPNIVRAREVLHGKTNLYMVMGYAGKRTLHDYQVQVISENDTIALPANVAEDFCKQELGAVMHLQSAKVCHRDLKPTNIILSDDNCTLQLTDFGLAMLVCGPGQLLGEACGSFPFVAPEVLERRTTGERYDGFHADSWSLAINLYELECGPYSVEKLLRWVPRAPSSIERKIKDVKCLAESAVSSLPAYVPSSIRRAITGMLNVLPKARWSAEKALGPEGLNVRIQHVHVPSAPLDSPISLENRGPRALRTMNCVVEKDVASRDVLATMLKDLKSTEETCPFAQRAAEVMLAFDGFPTKVLANPMLGPFHKPHSVKKSSCGIVMSLYPRVGEESEDERRSKLRSIHANMNITDAHFDSLLKLVRSCFSEAGIRADAGEDAVAKIAKLRPDITADYMVRSHSAQQLNSGAWRKLVLESATDAGICVYAQHLATLFTQDPRLHDSPAAHWDVEFIRSNMQQYLSSSILFFIPLEAIHRISDAAFQCLANHVLSALQAAKFPPNAVEILHLALLAERYERGIILNASAYVSGVVDNMWPRAMEKLHNTLVEHNKLSYFAEQQGMQRCLQHLTKIFQTGKLTNQSHLSEAHWELGLTNNHFDDFMTCFESAVGCYVSSSSMRRIMESLSSLRPLVLKGGAARQAMALMEFSGEASTSEEISEKTAPSSPTQPASATKGCPFIDSWPPKIYETLLEDARIGSLFGHREQCHFREAVGKFMQSVTRKQSTGTAKHALTIEHQKWVVTNYDFDCFMKSLRVGIPELRNEESSQQLGRLEVMRSWIVTGCPRESREHANSLAVPLQQTSQCPFKETWGNKKPSQ